MIQSCVEVIENWDAVVDDWSIQPRRPSEATSITSEVNRLRRKIMGWLVPSLDEHGSPYARLSKDVSHRLTESLRDVDLIDEAYASNSITARSPVYPINLLRQIDVECQAIVSGRLSERDAAAAASARSRSLQALICSTSNQATGRGRSQDLPNADASLISDRVRSWGYFASVPILTQAASPSRYSDTSTCERRLPVTANELVPPPTDYPTSGASTEITEGDHNETDVSVESRSRLNWLTEATAFARTEVSRLRSHDLSSYRPSLMELRDHCVRFLAFSQSVESYLAPSQADREFPPSLDTDLAILEQTTQQWLDRLVTLVNSNEELKQEITAWRTEKTDTSADVFTEDQEKQRPMSSISWWHNVLQTISGLKQRVQSPGHPALKLLADLVAQIESIGVR
ncbi:unnamed protein product, partial [Dibothriocephalus latus]